jgi:uncharacterized coiled-coil protein SlyX
MNGLTDFEQLKQTVEDQGEIIRQQADQIERLTSELHQLFGGLFNHGKQTKTLDQHVSSIFGHPRRENCNDDPHYYASYPTTRQGDILEKKVEELEREFDTQTAEVKTITLQTKDNVIQLRYALQQLGAMLYNQETQKSSWREIRDIIMPTNQYWIDAEADDFVRTEDIYGNELVVNTSKWSTPTTKQGDDLEHRMDNLEAKLAQFGELFPKNCEAKLPECVEERKKSSASLCGNE